MARIPVQPVASQVVEQSLASGRLPSVFLFHGEMDDGPLEMALYLAKAFVCEKGGGVACDRCPPCIAMHRFRHPALVPVFNDDRLPRLRQLTHWVMTDGGFQPLRLRFELLGEINNLMARQRDRWLSPVSAEKKSFPQGVKLKADEITESLDQLARWDRELRDPAPLPKDAPYYEIALEAARKVQDSLDRSILTKENLLAVQEKTRLSQEGGRWVVIQHMERMNHQTVPALLKWLEEPPEGTRFVLMTPALHLLHPEVAEPLSSRSQVIGFRSLSTMAREGWLRKRFRLKPETPVFAEMAEIGDLPPFLKDLLVENTGEGGYNATSVAEALESMGPAVDDILTRMETAARLQFEKGLGFPRHALKALEKARGLQRTGNTTARNQIMKLALDLIS